MPFWICACNGLTQLEQDKLATEYQEIKAKILELKEILDSDTRVRQIIKDELHEIREAYTDDRRTRIIPVEAEIQM